MARAINFHFGKQKILSGEKTQTIRPERSPYWLNLEKGDKVNLWWFQRSSGPKHKKLLETRLKETPFTVEYQNFTEDLAVRDGFKSLKEMRTWFEQTHDNPDLEKKFVVIRWE